MPQIITNNEKETAKFANDFAKTLKGGETIGLIGDLGAGKTCFSQSLAAALGIKETVNSPTFVIMKVYENNSGLAKNICHVDAYRLNSYQDLEALGIEDYISNPNAIVIIEWADKVKNGLPNDTIYLEFKHDGENRRTIHYHPSSFSKV